jgi:riboflavin transporter FmnP
MGLSLTEGYWITFCIKLIEVIFNYIYCSQVLLPFWLIGTIIDSIKSCVILQWLSKRPLLKNSSDPWGQTPSNII